MVSICIGVKIKNLESYEKVILVSNFRETCECVVYDNKIHTIHVHPSLAHNDHIIRVSQLSIKMLK